MDNDRFASIRFGFHKVSILEPSSKSILIVCKGGTIHFKGSAHIGKGSKLRVDKEANLVLGDNFAISANSTINCYKSIKFGKDIQFSWDCLVMDTDSHAIFSQNGKRINENREIVFGDKIWIGCRSTILKGSVIPSGCVIGACSFVSGSKFDEHSIIAGSPAISIKVIGHWDL